MIYLAKIALSLTLGGLIGLEREFHGRAAGLRTHILVCLGATIITMASLDLFRYHQTLTSQTVLRIDLGRLVAGIVTGIGFLGAGVIFRSGNVVRGLTTAASIWFTSGVGIAVGIGSYLLAAEAAGFALCTLFLLRKLEDVIRQDRYGSLKIISDREGNLLDEVTEICEAMGFSVKRYRTIDDLDGNLRTITLELKFKRQEFIGLDLVERLSNLRGIHRVEWR
jgi:putative Mg2+ transporter-C (MgtC) family protein